MKQIKVLYVEDEPNLGTIVSETLEQKGFQVKLLRDGREVLATLRTFKPEICVLDVMLPHIDGFTLGKMIRESHRHMPIIFLTAKTQTADVVEGFQSGGTDYMRKPFSIEELILRIHNQLRFTGQKNEPDPVVALSSFSYYPHKLELRHHDRCIQLSSREAEVLNIFSKHINTTIDRKQLLLSVWGDDSIFNSRNLDVYVRKLREYFQPDPAIRIITLKGKGYQFVVEK